MSKEKITPPFLATGNKNSYNPLMQLPQAEKLQPEHIFAADFIIITPCGLDFLCSTEHAYRIGGTR